MNCIDKLNSIILNCLYIAFCSFYWLKSFFHLSRYTSKGDHSRLKLSVSFLKWIGGSTFQWKILLPSWIPPGPPMREFFHLRVAPLRRVSYNRQILFCLDISFERDTNLSAFFEVYIHLYCSYSKIVFRGFRNLRFHKACPRSCL